jgi:hypothetical protein
MRRTTPQHGLRKLQSPVVLADAKRSDALPAQGRLGIAQCISAERTVDRESHRGETPTQELLLNMKPLLHDGSFNSSGYHNNLVL